MNDAMLSAKKLKDLVQLARDASTPFEEAAVFAATQALVMGFDKEEERFSGNALAKVEEVRWHICAAVGYDITNGHDKGQHISWALGAVSTLQDALSKQSYVVDHKQ